MNNNPLVSVFMPAYNHEDFVTLAIESLLAQNYTNIEFIIINDGSTDMTHDKIMNLYEQCQTKFKRFKYISRENRGLLNTLKEMENLIKGKYLTLLYSDDIYTKNRISLQVETMESNPEYAMCYGKMIGINSHSEEIKRYKTKHMKSGYVFNDLLSRNFIPAPTVMMNVSILKEVGGYDLNYQYDDYPLWLKISKNNKIFFVDEYLVKYRTHDNNYSNDLIRTIKNVEKILNSWNQEIIFNKIIKHFYLKSFYELARSDYDYKTEAHEYMLKSLSSWYHPKFIKSLFRFYFKKYWRSRK